MLPNTRMALQKVKGDAHRENPHRPLQGGSFLCVRCEKKEANKKTIVTAQGGRVT